MNPRTFLNQKIGKVFAFLAAGLPGFVIALPLNFLFVSQLGWSKPLAYALVLAVQVTLNFFMCRWFVFVPHPEKPLSRQFVEFMAGILGFRALDWLLYSFLVQLRPDWYLGFQLLNVVLFVVLKYKFSKRVLEGAP